MMKVCNTMNVSTIDRKRIRRSKTRKRTAITTIRRVRE
jgi:hypothetical protein